MLGRVQSYLVRLYGISLVPAGRGASASSHAWAPQRSWWLVDDPRRCPAGLRHGLELLHAGAAAGRARAVTISMLGSSADGLVAADANFICITLTAT